MAIYSVKYPIIFNPGSFDYDYTISFDGEVIYTGHAYEAEVDISPILQSYMNANLVNFSNNDLPIIDPNSVVKEFIVSNGTQSQSFLVANDYNDDWIQQREGDYITSYSVTGKYHPDDLVFVDVNSESGTANIQLGENISVTGNNSSQITISPQGIIDVDLISSSQLSNASLLRDIIFVNGQYIAGGSAATIATSADAENWTINNIPNASFTIYRILYVNNQYLVVGSAGNIWTSPNLTDWSKQESNTIYAINDVNYYNGIYIAVLNGGSAILRSSDAINWESVSVEIENLSDVTVGNGIFLLTYSPYTVDRYIITKDGINFEYHTLSAYKGAPLYANGNFLVFGINETNISTDGINWTRGVHSYSYMSTSVYANGTYFGFKNGGLYLTSRDGINWEEGQYEIESQGSLNGSIFANNKITVVGQYGQWFNLEYFFTPVDITVNGQPVTYEITDGCERYTLYWVNKLGGRSQLLIHAKSRELTDNNFTRIRTNYNRLDSSSFENITIQNDTLKKWVLYTELLDDYQSELIIDLFSSPKVCLHDHRYDRIISVVITDSTVRHLTRKNDNMFSYTINVSQAQNHLRK